MRFGLFLLKTLTALLLTLALADVVVRAALPHTLRLSENFSAAYLERAITEDNLAQKLVVIGDSALWGYRVRPKEAAASRLRISGLPVENLSFEGGSTVNTYALLKLLQLRSVRPQRVLFNINLKEFNAADSAYQTLYPTLERLTWGTLTPAERGLLKATQQKTTFDAKSDAALGRIWALYGMRADIREQLYNAADAVTAVRNGLERYSGEERRSALAHVATSEKFIGTYDLSALSDANVEVVFLKKLCALLQQQHIPAVALLTPTNHGLLHEYIDTGEYDSQLSYLKNVLRARGIKVLDYDRRFSPGEFLDNDHLTVAGNARMAELLHKDLAK